ncbi:nitrate reductase molybdenum cofactor assembly chaperone [Hyphomicrobium denitrificans ATCC 51888]|uniref:Nitrate reductase molybdenum cofactor assembly chaperone n=1 Tax=Hyphomicrobium denitrificans (strain ATCC 51888 / DSM 1869 / NCIMB 11706 / TK 0415) TaxID=582899 RepID=D8JUF2_HYPDA|nr:nitrate reductase molybdenum cofactor assembly chaperone [Hyphomicrobium denitrificans]ADJ22742.1 nitrate reductase molybdenum cofactor assembly chaperone [Hyphomicrobium denitrificans ATCC 51888]
MTKTFKALSALLTYPSEELQAEVGGIRDLIEAEDIVPLSVRSEMEPFLTRLASDDLYDLQEHYVDLFDKTRRLSLHLFEHVHGESRDRGQAMVDLAALYEKHGLLVDAHELPDYLPLFLEYLSTQPLEEAQALLTDTAHIIAALEERLVHRNSAYASVFAAILAIAGCHVAPNEKPINEADAAPDDLAALDAAWEETAVTFGPGEPMGGCSVERLKIQMRAGQRDVRRQPQT